MHEKATYFFENATTWIQEMLQLRDLVLDCGLTEDFKWKHPCYTFNGKNILIIHGFKEYVALNFLNGALLKDTDNILVQQTKNVQTGRQLRFKNLKEITDIATTIKSYIFEAIEVEKAGIKVPLKTTEEFDFPEELTAIFEKETALKLAFEALTPGRQKGYLLHFSGAKQPKTRIARIEKYKDRILNGVGLHDCVCGHSKRMPRCDGSHKHFTKK